MSSNGILSKGIKLGYSTSGTTSYTDIPDLQTIPDLGGDVEALDITTLADDNFRYMNGLKNFGSMEFGFLYDGSNFATLKGLEGQTINWCVEFPDTAKFAFSAEPHVKTNGVGVNAPIQFTLTLNLKSDIAFTAGH